ncbi:MAG TPA: ABC transporter permease [Streptosporangiaceae bacterium]|jgi:peptide/nickel transport system permease protein
MPEPTEVSPRAPRPPLVPDPAASPPPAGPGGIVRSAAEEGLSVEARSQLRMAAERFIHHKLALVGLSLFVLLLLLSTAGAHLWRYSYSQITDQFGTGPSLQHPFGTDTIGHDLFAQVLAGTATSIETALVVAVIATAIGTLVGAAAGYYGGLADSVLMRFTDLVLVVPVLAVLLVLAAGVSGLAGNWLVIALVLAALFWTYLARLVRGTFLSLREREFVEAEWAIGASDRRIILRHMIPNAIGPIVVNATLTVALAMLVEAILSFLGLGIQPPDVSLGSLIAAGQGDATALPWLFYFPAGVLVLAILSVNFIGDGLRDALDPTQRVRA